MNRRTKRFLKRHWIEIIILAGVYLISFDNRIPSELEYRYGRGYFVPYDSHFLFWLKRGTLITTRELRYWAIVSPLQYVLLALGLILLFRKYALPSVKKEGQKRIVLVDDEQFMLDVYKNKFQENGYVVKTYFILEDDFIKEIADFKPDVIMTNITMPEIDGLQFTEKLKNNEQTKNIKVVALTTCSSREDRRKGFAAGMEDYLVKSKFTPNEVVREIDKIVSG